MSQKALYEAPESRDTASEACLNYSLEQMAL